MKTQTCGSAELPHPTLLINASEIDPIKVFVSPPFFAAEIFKRPGFQMKVSIWIWLCARTTYCCQHTIVILKSHASQIWASFTGSSAPRSQRCEKKYVYTARSPSIYAFESISSTLHSPALNTAAFASSNVILTLHVTVTTRFCRVSVSSIP